MNATYNKKAEAQSALEKAVRDYIAAAKADGDDSEETLEQIKNRVLIYLTHQMEVRHD